MNTAYSFFIGWFIIILLFYGSTKLEGTKTITYYILWLSVVLAIVTHYNTFTELIRSAVPPVQNDVSIPSTVKQ